MQKQMPLILPFIGAIFGGFLYDLFVFTGPSPINARGLGFYKLFHMSDQKRNKRDRERQREDSDNEQV